MIYSTGPGRGSAAGSIVLYLIGVTKVDPVKYGLYLRDSFLKSERKNRSLTVSRIWTALDV